MEIPLDDETYKMLEVQNRSLELITEVSRSIEDFVAMLIVIGSFSLGMAVAPQNMEELNNSILSFAGEAPAEEVPLLNRLYALMRRRRMGLENR